MDAAELWVVGGDLLGTRTDGWARGEVERAKGIEPSSLAWEARVMPLYDARAGC